MNAIELTWDELDAVREEEVVQHVLPPDLERGVTKEELMVTIRAGIEEMFK